MAAMPWFPFYWSQFDQDTAHWSCAEVGLYIRLLGHQWSHGSIPEDKGELMRIAREFDADTFNKCWNKCSNKFPRVAEGVLANRKLSTVILKQTAVSEKRSLAGKKSAEKRARIKSTKQ